MNPEHRLTLLRSVRRRLVRDSILIVIGAVCAFALVQAVAHKVLTIDPHYQPVLCVGMIAPMGLTTALVAYFSWRRLRKNQALAPVRDTFVLVTASVASFAAVEFFANRVLGSDPGYRPGLALGMVLPMTLIGGFFMAQWRRRGRALVSWSYGSGASLGRWMLNEALVVVVASTCTFAGLEYVTNRVLRQDPLYDPIYAVGMILPMGLVMGLVAYFFARRTNRSLSQLTDGITQVARGGFQVELEVAKAGPLKDVFLDFNKMTRELKTVQILRDDFINSFSHEFKTPITSIQGFASLLLEVSVSEEERNRYLQIIATESARLADLAHRTLLLSRLESQELILDQQWYSLDEELKQCAILLSARWEEKQIRFSVQLERVSHWGNAELMKQVWINLLSNAIQFTPPGGSVTLRLRQGSRIAVAFEDTGVGMTEEQRLRIFDKYYQADPSRTGRGLGLGLSIVRRIVELCGGTIEVRSTVDQGSVFTVFLDGLQG